nr:MAG: hypothetical protein [uncultured archaeon]
MVLANIWFPSEEDRKRIIAAVTTSAGGAGAVVTITIPDAYPPIDRTIPCPVLAIMAAMDLAVLAIAENEIWPMADQMAVAPTAVGEFLITGARTIDIWEQTVGLKHVLVVYVSKGSGQET